jgi:hypothetical protein
MLALVLTAAPLANVMCGNSCPMKAAKTSHCGGEKFSAACCCVKALTSTPATELGTTTQIAASAHSPASPVTIEPFAPTARALREGARFRTPHERTTPLTILYAAFLI